MALKISLMHPTARVGSTEAFPRGWMQACWDFYERCWWFVTHVEYVLVVHHTRFDKLFHEQKVILPPWGKTTIVCNYGRDCCVDQLNCAAKASDPQTKIMMGVMDDLVPPDEWDGLIEKAFPNLDEPWVVHASSGSYRDNDLAICGAMTRARYNQIGYALHPGYESLYSDDDFTQMAQKDGVLVEAKGIKFEHNHPCFGKGKWDEVYALQNNLNASVEGLKFFNERKAAGFPH